MTDVDPTTGLEADARLVHPYQTLKPYRCPSCGHAVRPGSGHYVVVPRAAPDLRRHWRRPCWERHLRAPNAR